MRTVIYPSKYINLSKIGEFISKAVKEAGFNASDAYEVELAVDEACCNIIDHAYGGESDNKLQCSIETTEDKVTISLRDHGKSFDPTKVSQPQLNVPLEKLKTRGVGLYLINKLMDKVHYESSKEKGNVLTLTKIK